MYYHVHSLQLFSKTFKKLLHGNPCSIVKVVFKDMLMEATVDVQNMTITTYSASTRRVFHAPNCVICLKLVYFKVLCQKGGKYIPGQSVQTGY